MKAIAVAGLAVLLGGGLLLYRWLDTKDNAAASERADKGPAILSETDWNDYIWPTDASTWKTSSFCEFRATHFHAGIDVSTNMQCGYNVFASRAGWLHSMVFEPHGYGWYLVLRHEDGFYTTYAHLDSFPERVDSAYRAKLKELGRSFGYVEWKKGEVPVSKKEIVAYTGATGAGPPHLHFEIRDKEFNPVHPEFAPALRVKDTIPPVIVSLMFTPLDPLSTVNGEYEAKVFECRRDTSGTYKIPGTVALRGKIGMLVLAHDYAQGFKDRETPYKLETVVNGKPFFRSEFARIRDGHEWHIRIDRDNAMMLAQKGEFRKLYREEGSALSVYESLIPGDGVLSVPALGAGKKKLSITASDISGNRCVAHGNIVIADSVPFSVGREEADAFRVLIPDPAKLSSFRVEKRSGKQWKLFKKWEQGELPASILIKPGEATEEGFFRFTATDKGGIDAPCVYHALGVEAAGSMTISRSVVFDHIVYEINGGAAFDYAPTIAFESGGKTVYAQTRAESPSRYRAAVRPWDGYSGPAKITVRAYIDGKVTTDVDSINMTMISATKGGALHSSDGKFKLEFKPNDVYRSMLCWIVERTDSSKRVYTAFPDDIPLAGKPEATIDAPVNAERSFIKAVSPRAFLKFSRTEVNAQRATVSGAFGRYLGAYACEEDVDGPFIVSQKGGRKGGMSFTIRDDKSGVNPQTIIARSENSIYTLNYDERANTYLLPPSKLSRKGGRTLTIEAQDRLGNRTTKTVSLR